MATELTAGGPPESVGLNARQLAQCNQALDALVERRQIPSWQLLIARHGTVVYHYCGGYADPATQTAVTEGTQWRIYSMTKPLTSVAALQLYEAGALQLTDPIAEYLPQFSNPQVYVSGDEHDLITEPATEPIQVWHLLTHTAGFVYGQDCRHPVDAIARARGLEVNTPPGMDLSQVVTEISQVPLLFQPGTKWNYSCATDVLGALIEVVSGQSLDRYIEEHITQPLNMADTQFATTMRDTSRLARLYRLHEDDQCRPDDTFAAATMSNSALLGGAGMVATAKDYYAFLRCLLAGASIAQPRILGATTINLMTHNQLPHNATMADLDFLCHPEEQRSGNGFGLGFGVTVDPAATHTLSCEGDFFWGGYAGTTFVVSPQHDLVIICMASIADGPRIMPILQQTIYPAIEN